MRIKLYVYEDDPDSVRVVEEWVMARRPRSFEVIYVDRRDVDAILHAMSGDTSDAVAKIVAEAMKRDGVDPRDLPVVVVDGRKYKPHELGR